MSTVPKLSYAKIANRSKNKLQGNSLQLNRSNEDDIFGHMNQDNLRYIQKQIKLKKNRSQNERSNYMQKELTEEMLMEDDLKRNQLLDKYRREEEVSQKQPHLEETQRKESSNHKGLNLPEEKEEIYEEQPDELPNQLGNSLVKEKPTSTVQPMYNSLPYDTRNRVISIQGNFRQSVSSNLNKSNDEGPKFIDFLNQYITDLNHSKHLKNKTAEVEPFDTQQSKSKRNTYSQRSPPKKPSQISQKQPEINYRAKYSYETFGQQRGYREIDVEELKEQLRKERYNTIILAQEIQKLREENQKKNTTIEQLIINKELLQEEIVHMKRQQEIRQGNRAPSSYRKESEQPPPKIRYRTADQNILYEADNLTNFMTHQRHASANPNRHRNNTTQKETVQEKRDLFKGFELGNQQIREEKASRESSLEKCEKEWKKFNKEHNSNLQLFSMRKKARPGKGMIDFY